MYLQTYIKYLSAYAPSIFAKANVKHILATNKTKVILTDMLILGTKNIPIEHIARIRYIACLKDI